MLTKCGLYFLSDPGFQVNSSAEHCHVQPRPFMLEPLVALYYYYYDDYCYYYSYSYSYCYCYYYYY